MWADKFSIPSKSSNKIYVRERQCWVGKGWNNEVETFGLGSDNRQGITLVLMCSLLCLVLLQESTSSSSDTGSGREQCLWPGSNNVSLGWCLTVTHSDDDNDGDWQELSWAPGLLSLEGKCEFSWSISLGCSESWSWKCWRCSRWRDLSGQGGSSLASLTTSSLAPMCRSHVWSSGMPRSPSPDCVWPRVSCLMCLIPVCANITCLPGHVVSLVTLGTRDHCTPHVPLSQVIILTSVTWQLCQLNNTTLIKKNFSLKC